MKKNAWTIGVKNRKSFQKFVGLLLEDYHQNQEKWENNRLDHFLEAMSAYVGALEGYYQNVHPDRNPDQASWRAFADILRGAVNYE